MYSIQQDPPWVARPLRGSMAPSASVYSDDDEYEVGPRLVNHPDMPAIAPLRLQKKPSYHPSYHAHRDQHISDHGPPLRESRLPIFKQVRGLLNKPPPLSIPRKTVKYDEFSGNISETGKDPQMKASAYRNPYQGTFEARRLSRPSRRQRARPDTGRSISPVSVLNDSEMEQIMQSPDPDWQHDVSPIDEAEGSSRTHDCSKMSNVVRSAVPETPPEHVAKAIKRKPAPNRPSLSPETMPPLSSPISQDSEYSGIPDTAHPIPMSHFSWITCAPSVAPTYAMIDISSPTPGDALPQSRFSWSTTNTQMTNNMRPDSPPPSPPPPIPGKHKPPPVQSILSRHRPIQRIEREEWTPPARKASLPGPGLSTPISARSKPTLASRSLEAQGSGKKLPPPPELMTPVSPLSHLETLLAEEQDKIRQSRNIQHAVADLEKVEKASPMVVSYAQVKDADRKLKELRIRLAEVQLEEREIGIAISRARRKEGEEEGLWVRRVTG